MENEKALQNRPDNQLTTMAISEDMMEVIKATIFPDASAAELKLYVYYCEIKGVHPMSKLIHPIKRKDKITFQSSIDYLRSESEDAGDYLGMNPPIFDWNADGTLDSATVVVKREIKGNPVEFSATAYFDEYCPGPPNDFMWKKMPKHMLAKCAEALARRMAWPKRLGSLYVPEEMMEADTDPKQKGKDRAASVKPAHQSAGPVIDAETTASNPLDDEIMEILGYLYKGAWENMNNGLIEASKYKNKDTKKEHSFGLDRIANVSADWKLKTVLPRLRKWKAEAEALDAEMKGTPGVEGDKPEGEQEQNLPM